MRKYVLLTSFFALSAGNAYGDFDFNNYQPTLGAKSQYTLHFNPVSGETPTDRIITSYTFNPTDAKWNEIQYAFSYSIDQNAAQDTVFNDKNTDKDINGLFTYGGIRNSISIDSNMPYYPFGNYPFEGGKPAVDEVPRLGNITAEFVAPHDYSYAYIENYQVTADPYHRHPVIGDITVDFINSGGIRNTGGIIGDITGNFIGTYSGISNYISDVIADDNSGAYVQDSTLPVIGNITANFIKNRAGIYNNGIIGDITGYFIDNSGNMGISAILNYGHIGNITGDFINNHSNWDEIYNNDSWVNPYAVAIDNYGTVGDITGNFVHNIDHRKDIDSPGTGIGSVIYNGGQMGNITGDFYQNYAVGIYNTNTIGDVVGNFIGNQDVAIYNQNKINTISGNFIGNVVSRNNQLSRDMTGQVLVRDHFATITNNTHDWENAPMHFLSEKDSYVISDNYNIINGVRTDVAIYSGKNTRLWFENNNETSWTVNDKIEYRDLSPEAPQPTIQYILDITGDNTGYTQFNNTISGVQNVNITNGKMFFGKTPSDYTGTQSIGAFAKYAPMMQLKNGTFNIANGYTETVNLSRLHVKGNNNYISIDLDIGNYLADMINIETGILTENNNKINLTVNALSNVDIDDYVIWFAKENSHQKSPFTLSSVSGLDYDLNIYADPINGRYGLVKKGNWHPVDYLSSLAGGTAGTMSNTVQKLTNSMQKRVGDLQWLGQDSSSQSDLNKAFWTRGIHKNFDVQTTSVGLSGLEFGYDKIVSSNNRFKWYVGGLGYLFSGNSSFKEAEYDISGFGLGVYAMLLEQSGWFADLVFRQHFITNETANVQSNYTASSLNMEIGKEFVFADVADTLKWFVKPSIEGTYISMTEADIGHAIQIEVATSKMLSLTLLGGPRLDLANGRKFQIYGKLGYTLDESDEQNMVINGIKTKLNLARDTIETGLGFDYRNANNSTSIYLELSYITGDNYSETSGNIGLRYAF